MKQTLTHTWTRDFTLAWAQWWSKYVNPRLIEVFGIGVDNQLSYFDGRLLETYRLADESEAFFHGVVNADPASGFFSEEKIEHYKKLIDQIRTLIGERSVRERCTDRNTFNRILELSREMYPWYAVSFLLPQEPWSAILIKKDPSHAPDILERLIDARKHSEGAVGEIVQYWRARARELLVSRGLDAKYASFVTFDELERMVDDARYAPPREELKERSKRYIFFREKVIVDVDRETFFVQQGFAYTPPSIDTSTQILTGVPASKGMAPVRGTVQIILRIEDVGAFQAGNILVTVMTNPYFIPAMRKTRAIITDEGGVTCHAAITARELTIPCIIGTKVATHVLKDGDRVEVDAEKGIVTKL